MISFGSLLMGRFAVKLARKKITFSTLRRGVGFTTRNIKNQ